MSETVAPDDVTGRHDAPIHQRISAMHMLMPFESDSTTPVENKKESLERPLEYFEDMC